MIKNKIHKCWRLGAGILFTKYSLFLPQAVQARALILKKQQLIPKRLWHRLPFRKLQLVNYKKLINLRLSIPFYIKVNKKENFAIVYGIDKKGKYSVPYKAFVCSTGRENDFTPNGTFTVSEKYRWRLMVDNTYAQYAVRIQGQIMLHSVPYTSPESDALNTGNTTNLAMLPLQAA